MFSVSYEEFLEYYEWDEADIIETTEEYEAFNGRRKDNDKDVIIRRYKPIPIMMIEGAEDVITMFSQIFNLTHKVILENQDTVLKSGYKVDETSAASGGSLLHQFFAFSKESLYVPPLSSPFFPSSVPLYPPGYIEEEEEEAIIELDAPKDEE
eukprot:TRINITY_DN3310_c0_g1_i1.p1 TRINITY_DN3310_c0_g1~~TRINITY_DN3310_c0_g1_i1.p1  ORF type:complete len:153 (-),score=28.58 TRINITY_DN3310_c0_g1_i1:62-520(-)